MASAEQLLNEAQFAFASISYGESLANKRHAVRARSLCRKIIRRHPGGMEAREARAILRRLGDETYVAPVPDQPRHMTRASHHLGTEAETSSVKAANATGGPVFDWSGLLAVLLMTPKIVLGIFGALAFALFALLGPFVLIVLAALVVLTGPFRSLLVPAQRRQLDEFIVSANEFIAERRRAGTGFG
jgi:hypothetical protein